jgi:hypothetical protein
MTHMVPVVIPVYAEFADKRFDLGRLQFEIPVTNGTVKVETSDLKRALRDFTLDCEGDPKPHQQAVIDTVCGLANSLMQWGRGAGQSWTRRRIAQRLLDDDGLAGYPNPLPEVIG